MFFTMAGLDGLAMILITALAAIHDGSAIPAALQYLQNQPTILPAIAGALGVSHVIGTALVQRAMAGQPSQSVATDTPSVATETPSDGPVA